MAPFCSYTITGSHGLQGMTAYIGFKLTVILQKTPPLYALRYC